MNLEPPTPPDPLGRLPAPLDAPPGGRCAACRRPATQWAGAFSPLGYAAIGVCSDCAAMVFDGRLQLTSYGVTRSGPELPPSASL